MHKPGSAPWNASDAQHIIDQHKSRPGALLPILHAIQDHFGWIPDQSVAMIATDLGVTRAEVHGVISFYHHFRTKEPGRHVVEVCRAEACQAQGSRALEAHARASLGVDYHQTTADQTITLEPVYCLGNCSCGPSVRIGDEIHARVDAKRFDALVEELRTEPLTLASLAAPNLAVSEQEVPS
ncbi:formate dehydrogenase subunit gamma [Parathalassolituus penaei]|uniref:NADH-quinone oxidoreductase subunit E n=1 Tax=Parathalassolituus penaei TaxID=2997323 RepID=A0A9X3IRT0_9GAMM|nr:formate dehydrogenase subunit gamma [Parathalassolituus penaei]MCY0964550.1 formate dehydrogenase subunit gamma [Parathalassolituus penaei]